MKRLIFSSYILYVLLILFIAYIIVTVNKLRKLKDVKDYNWLQLKKNINIRFSFTNSLKNKSDELDKIINKYRDELDVEKLLNIYEKHEEELNNIKITKEEQKTLDNTLKEIEKSIDLYNDSLLKYNKKIKVFPSSVIAYIFRFKKDFYFRTKKHM